MQCPFATITHPDPTDASHGGIKCQQISGGDGYSTMGDGVQTYMFSFGPLSGLADIRNGLPGTEPPSIFNMPGDPYKDATFNGAVGLTADGAAVDPTSPPNEQLISGHVDPRPIMDIGVMNGNIPAPTMAIDEDDEFFLTLTNVGMIMRPDLFERHTVHFHGYPNASSFYDGVPDASVAINIGASFTYYYLAPDAGTYFWHCHITPPEHLQMGMVGQIFVRPRQNRVPAGASLYQGLVAQQLDPRTACGADIHNPQRGAGTDILCSTPLPAANSVLHALNKSGAPTLYAYNDGDGSTAYDVEYPIQIHGFDPNFHFIGMTFNPEPFTDMKDKYFLLNGRGYPDTVNPNPLTTQVADGTSHYSQPLPTLINIPAGGRALLRISDLDVTEYQTLASLGIPMHVIGINARLLRDMAGNDMTYFTNSITLGGGESLDLILDASDTTKYPAGSTFYLYTPNLDHLANDAENFGGLMTEVHICNAVDPTTKKCS
ncbi:multicopper oxidase domain-containing protein [Trinickia symbiotica]|uniref:multicopper oxidase domain-containing protein n=1 Tax=Trinickia symbiotica TaxID=863227 RepID=UPI003F795470